MSKKVDRNAFVRLHVQTQEFGSRWIRLKQRRLARMVETFGRQYESLEVLFQTFCRGRPSDISSMASQAVIALAPTFSRSGEAEITMPDFVSRRDERDFRLMANAAAFLLSEGTQRISDRPVEVRIHVIRDGQRRSYTSY